MDLFKAAGEARIGEQPLAARMRPRTLEEFIGQEHIVGPGRLLRRAIQADQLASVIFFGPPGTGKTTLARVIAGTTRSHFISLNAVLSGVKEVREAIQKAQEMKDLHGRRTILFVDEVHRWNKAQQDALLPWVENGTIVLIGATTENPYFEVNKALVSRSRIFQLQPLEPRHLYQVAEQVLRDPERGYGRFDVHVDGDALAHLVEVAGGDARSLLNALELAVETTPARFPPPPGEVIRVTMTVAEESIQRRAVLYDKEGDYHFDTISAFIKSLRGSDPDAALYWMARMIYAGEDPAFVFRRMVIFAAEDVGLADPDALVVVQAAAAAYDRVGLPEGRFHLSQAALYLATAPKSNSTMAFFDALKTVEEERGSDVPVHLMDGSRDAEGLGHGEGYQYPHAFRDHWVAQQYLPDALRGRVFYRPGAVGHEGAVREEVARRREAQLAAMAEAEGRTPEILTSGPAGSARDAWLARTVSAQGGRLGAVRDRLVDGLRLARHHVVLNAGGDDGLFVWELLRRVPQGGVWVNVRDPAAAERIRMPSSYADGLGEPRILVGDPAGIPALLEEAGAGDQRFEAVVGRNLLALRGDKAAVLSALRRVCAAGARLALAETVPSRSQRLGALLPADALEEGLRERVAAAERDVSASDPRTAWDEEDLARLIGEAGFRVRERSLEEEAAERRIRKADIERWLDSSTAGSRYGRSLAARLGMEETALLREALLSRLADRDVPWNTVTAFVTAEA